MSQVRTASALTGACFSRDPCRPRRPWLRCLESRRRCTARLPTSSRSSTVRTPASLTMQRQVAGDPHLNMVQTCAVLRVTKEGAAARPGSHAIILDGEEVSCSVSGTPSASDDFQGTRSTNSLGTPPTMVSASSASPREYSPVLSTEAGVAHGSPLNGLLSAAGIENQAGRPLMILRHLPPPAVLFWALRCLGQLLWLLMSLLSVAYTYAMMPLSIGVLPYRRS